MKDLSANDLLDLGPKLEQFTRLTKLQILKTSDQIDISKFFSLKSLKILHIGRLHPNSYDHLNTSLIEQLILDYGDMDIFYYLNSTLTHLTVNEVEQPLSEMNDNIIISKLTHLKLNMTVYDRKEVLFIDLAVVLKRISEHLIHFSLKLRAFKNPRYCSGTYWISILSSLSVATHIELFVRVDHIDRGTIDFTPLSSTFEAPFWSQRSLPVNIYYSNDSVGSYWFHTVPYPQMDTVQDGPRCYGIQTLIASTLYPLQKCRISRSERVAKCELRIDQFFDDRTYPTGERVADEYTFYAVIVVLSVTAYVLIADIWELSNNRVYVPDKL
ncbi:unnamed protein product [Didymodactylos carnosus]|uniref:Uncharacterized protein n=1 Tax=Didymodactylos carnosus TaxID=1234261 RepID=A0A8S2PZL2_9BILA|nr:unnamed protein product [Didymodactylos carnosus]CAF4076842.1 unnamed protein product [Didymodactylos carnosus]